MTVSRCSHVCFVKAPAEIDGESMDRVLHDLNRPEPKVSKQFLREFYKLAILETAKGDGIAIYLATGATVYAATSAKHLGLINFPDHVETILVAGDNDEEGKRAFINLDERYQ